MDKEQLENDAYAVAEATNDDGTVKAEITDVIRDDSDVYVKIFPLLPQESGKEERFRWPKIDSDEYKLVRLCRETIGGIEGLPHLIGEEVKVDPDTWDIVLEEPESEERVKVEIDFIAALISVGFLVMAFLPFAFLLLYPFGVTPPMNIPQAVVLILIGLVGATIMGGFIDG